MIINRRTLLSSAAALSLAGPRAFAQTERTFTPEAFGAVGDGITNDTDAFAAMASAVRAAGGGTVVLRRGTYIVGRQLQGRAARTGYTFDPAPIMDFVGLQGRLIIQGNRARLKAAPGLRYGTFTDSGRATRNAMPYLRPGELATPYRFMIRVEDCAGPVQISDIELDGGLAGLAIGGQYGDTGWQINATGLALINNRGAERIIRVVSHHHAQDGILIDGLDRDRAAGAASLLQDVRCEGNGRQGVSLVGGRGYTFERCQFTRTGKAGLASAPGAGVDVEAEQDKRIRNIAFRSCTFADNYGPGLVADSGDSERLSFSDCTFIGTTNWAAWPNKPISRFSRCSFVGPIVHALGDPNPERAVQFIDCTFRDDPALSPTGVVYGGENTDRPIGDLPGNRNVLFRNCRFLLTHRAVLPWSVDVIYQDCVLSQRATTASYPRGTYVGRNVISGRVTIAGSLILGELIINGRTIPRGRQP
jgi:hypothetical protein